MHDPSLVHDWNAPGRADAWSRTHVQLLDETLRDGLQAPGARVPSVDDQRAMLHAMAAVGVHAVNLGMPARGMRAAADVLALARELATARLPLAAGCAARTRVADVEAIADVAQRSGLAIEVCAFVPASAIRHHVDGRTVDDALRCGAEAATVAVRAGLPVMFVAEDTSRAQPEALRRLFAAAIEWGATRLCLADTVGHATPEGVRRLVRFVREEVVAPSGRPVSLDWHGHDDRGLALANALAAAEAGADRIHATALGIGERAGNVALEQLVANLHLLGVPAIRREALAALGPYVALAARACGVDVPPRQPVVGRDAFRTGSGVHAASLLRAREGAGADPWLEDHVYCAMPASALGAAQAVDVGPQSGRANVRWWLAAHGRDARDAALCEALLAVAKDAGRVLADAELHAHADAHAARTSGEARGAA